jgi:hypothetical protein
MAFVTLPNRPISIVADRELRAFMSTAPAAKLVVLQLAQGSR